MAQGSNFTGLQNSSFPSWGTNNVSFEGNLIPKTSLASFILSKFGITHNVTEGHGLAGYDIKSQDAFTMLRLSLLAADPLNLTEVYSDPDGTIQAVKVGFDTVEMTGTCIAEQATDENSPKTDYVVVRGREPLPIKYSKPSVNATNGALGIHPQYPLSGFPVPWNKQSNLYESLWVEFNNSPQDSVIQNQLQFAVRRDDWESLIGYQMHLPPIPGGVSFSLSATTPRNLYIDYLGGFTSQRTISAGANIVDIGGITAIGAPILDIQDGPSIIAAGGITAGFTYTENDYFVLLAPEYGLNELSRGQNWFLLPGSAPGSVQVLIARGTGNDISRRALDPLIRSNLYTFRSSGPGVESFSDAIAVNTRGGREGLSLNGDAFAIGAFPADLVEGLGTSFGYELATSLLFSYTVQRPSISLKSENSNLLLQAAAIATQGIYMTPIVVQSKPLSIAVNGTLIDVPRPYDEETNPTVVDSVLDSMEGSIIDITLPIFEGAGAAEFSRALFDSVNSEQEGKTITKTYTTGGYTIMPGNLLDNSVVLSIEHTYSDQNSFTTSITTGAKYYSVQSFNDSQYVKRTETLTRRGVIVAGNNSAGQFIVQVDGFGQMEALNTLTRPLYPGDSVEVRILNSPIET